MPAMAPLKCAVLPLSKNEVFDPLLQRVSTALTRAAISFRADDSNASIGKRYARADELGIPFGITIDFDSVSDATVTVRERDSMQQLRGDIDAVVQAIADMCRGEAHWKSVSEERECGESVKPFPGVCASAIPGGRSPVWRLAVPTPETASRHDFRSAAYRRRPRQLGGVLFASTGASAIGGRAPDRSLSLGASEPRLTARGLWSRPRPPPQFHAGMHHRAGARSAVAAGVCQAWREDAGRQLRRRGIAPRLDTRRGRLRPHQGAVSHRSRRGSSRGSDVQYAAGGAERRADAGHRALGVLHRRPAADPSDDHYPAGRGHSGRLAARRRGDRAAGGVRRESEAELSQRAAGGRPAVPETVSAHGQVCGIDGGGEGGGAEPTA
eukprot:ctg_70.g30